MLAVQYRLVSIVIWSLGWVLVQSCARVGFDQSDSSCVDDTGCIDGSACHPLMGQCVRAVSYGCDTGTCPSQVLSDETCLSAGSFIPCSDTAIACEDGCRTCRDDLTWSECKAAGCVLGTATSCASCADDCTQRISHADADCVASNGSYQCRYTSCEPGFQDTDGDSANGCESACALSETCDEKDNDCDRLVDNMDAAAVQADCGGQWPGAADVDAWACSLGLCRPAICLAGMLDTNGFPGDGCEDTCAAGGAETCDSLDNDCDGIVDNEAAIGCTTYSSAPDSTADNRCLCTPVAPYLYPLTMPCGDATCDDVDDDCDGTADEDYVSDTSCFLSGACAAGNVGSSCDAGVETSCSAWLDTDGDGMCDSIDTDDDGDAWPDEEELDCGTDPLQSDSVPTEDDFDLTCGPQMPVVYDALGRTLTISSIYFNGVQTNVRTVSPGSSVSLRVIGNVVDHNTRCPTCVTQFYVRLNGVFSLCLGSSTSDWSFDTTANFAAPVDPGTYFINPNQSWLYECSSATNVSATSTSRTVVILIVE